MRISLGTLTTAFLCSGPLWAQGAPPAVPAPGAPSPDAGPTAPGDAPSPPADGTDPAAETPVPVEPVAPPAVAPPPDPRASARAMYQAAREAYTQGRLEGALTLVEKAFEQFDAPTLLLARAYILDRLGRRPEAAAAYTTYLRRRPDDPERGRFERRVGELNGTIAPMGGPQTSFPRDLPPPPKPEKPKPPKTHDGLLFFRPSIFFGQLDGTALYGNDGTLPSAAEGAERTYSSTYYGVGIAIGLVPTPGFAIAIEGQMLNSDFTYTRSYTDAGTEHSEDGDEAGPGATVSLDLHFFTSPTGGLHLNLGGGFMAMGHDDFDSINGFGGHGAIGWAFWLNDKLALDPMFRVDMIPDGDRQASIVYKAINVGLLWD
ncbi:MAG: tetratricopeptide repeat protein [Polyangiaceae bacterium]